jgi:phosphoglycolate phosphatase
MKPSLVLFDLDGTLVDTLPDIAAAVGAALATIGAPPPPLDVVKGMVGDGARMLVRRALGALDRPEKEDEVFQSFLASYRDNVCVDSRLYPGAAETLAGLRAQGVARAVLTNKPGDLARRLLETLGVAGSLDAIVGDGDGFPRKPDPAAALSIAARLGASVAGLVVVGDGLPDMRLARALGATAVAATWGYVPTTQLAAESPGFLADSLAAVARFLS